MFHRQTDKTLHVATPGALGPVTPEEAGLLEKLDLARLPADAGVEAYARLAARLTGWRIDIKSESDFAATAQQTVAAMRVSQSFKALSAAAAAELHILR